MAITGCNNLALATGNKDLIYALPPTTKSGGKPTYRYPVDSLAPNSNIFQRRPLKI